MLAFVSLMLFIWRVTSSFDPIQVVCEVNGMMVPAIIDTGAEITVMSTSFAKRCNLCSIIDTTFSGKAIGVGSSDIVGGIESLGMRIGPLSFQNKISILKNTNSRCDFIIGLDVLKRFNSEISMREKMIKLYVRNNEIRIPMLQSSGPNMYENEKEKKQYQELPAATRSTELPVYDESIYRSNDHEDGDEDLTEEEQLQDDESLQQAIGRHTYYHHPRSSHSKKGSNAVPRVSSILSMAQRRSSDRRQQEQRRQQYREEETVEEEAVDEENDPYSSSNNSNDNYREDDDYDADDGYIYQATVSMQGV